MGNFILVELGIHAREIYHRLMEKGVIVRYGGIWGLPLHVRVTIGTPEENEFFLQKLREVLDPTFVS
jgi:histidinol-phosphate aminotransferase